MFYLFCNLSLVIMSNLTLIGSGSKINLFWHVLMPMIVLGSVTYLGRSIELRNRRL